MRHYRAYLFFLLFLFQAGISLLRGQALPDSLSKIRFIHKLTSFIREEEHLRIDQDFYSDYEPGLNMLTYLYVSSPDSIYSTQDGPFTFYGTSQGKAVERRKHYDSLSQHTLIYHTAGNSNARINHRLLLYDKASIAFIIFHEAIHQHLDHSGLKIAYAFEEALCDLNGNYGTRLFAKTTQSLKRRDADRLITMNEHICETIIKFNKGNRFVKKGDRAHYRQQCDSVLHLILLKGTLFHHDRFDYPVNNAFLLRNSFYGENYFLLKDVLDNNYHKQLKEFLKFAFTLPEKKEDAMNRLIQKCVERIPPE